MTTPSHPTIVEERSGRRDGTYGLVLAVLVYAIVSPLLRDGPTDTSTRIAVGVLAVVAVALAVMWVARRRSPGSLVVGDDAIELIPAGSTRFRKDTTLRIDRTAGSLRLRNVGSVRSRTLMLSSVDGDTAIPLHFIDRQEVVDACHRHGWDFGD